jgi:hypothetical protein
MALQRLIPTAEKLSIVKHLSNANKNKIVELKEAFYQD